MSISVQMSGKWDIVFLVSGSPLPAILDMARYARENGSRTLLVQLDRDDKAMRVDRALISYEVATIKVSYKAVSISRFYSLPLSYFRIRRLIHNRLKGDAIIVPCTYDLLVIAWILCIGKNYRIRYQVRDLHRLQLGTGLVTFLFSEIERMLLRRCEMIIVSAPGFYTEYYAKIFHGPAVLVENTPNRSTWAGFRRKPRSERVFRIGFVGIVRYAASLRTLILSVKKLRDVGWNFEIVFAGGGDPAILSELRDAGKFVSVFGPYEYTRDIKKIYSDVDLIYAVYDSNDKNCQIAIPNKFYESIITRIPILVAEKTFLEIEVRRLGIGEAVKSEDIDRLSEILRETRALDGWYQRSERALEQLIPDVLYDRYCRSLADCMGKQAQVNSVSNITI